ncbi:hypothetical protein V512_004730 [Mesotoga sp. Brook.08.105.5.1]|nr:hypothetical protein V512_004730 [Mesotoga sp. Brook.08.105.5.1]
MHCGASVDAMPAKNMPGRKAGEDHARSQCPEKHLGTQGPLRGEGKLASHLRWPVPAAPAKRRQLRKRTSRGSLRSREKRESQSLVK